MKRILYIFLLVFYSLAGYAWNAAGHKVVAQIAFDNLSPAAKKMCYKYLRTRHQSPNTSFVTASIWMDQIRIKKINWYDHLHYIDIPFSSDGTKLPPVDSPNAVWAIKNALTVLTSKKTNVGDKKLALRMLIHIVGDVHQPLHAIKQVSARFPRGDAGGNLFPLSKNPIGTNLHQYWDNGAGFFLGKYDEARVKRVAHELEEQWPCNAVNTQTIPAKWAKMSHKLALKNAYQLLSKDAPDRKYQMNAQMLVQKQVAFAGCRLATLLNKLA